MEIRRSYYLFIIFGIILIGMIFLFFLDLDVYYNSNIYDASGVSSVWSIFIPETSGESPSTFWITDQSLNKIEKLNSAYTSVGECDAVALASNTPSEVVANSAGTTAWVLYALRDEIYELTWSGCSHTLAINDTDLNDAGCPTPSALAYNGSDFWVASGTYIQHFNASWNSQGDGFSVTNCRGSADLTIVGLATNGTDFFVLNYDTSASLNEICVMTKTGTLIDRINLKSTEINMAASAGIGVTDGSVFWVSYPYADDLYFIEQDDINPNIVIEFPINNTEQTNPLDINYSVSDTGAVGSCWYSNDSGQNNNTIVGCANLTGYAWELGENVVRIWVNDTSNNVNSSSVTFTITESVPPEVTSLTESPTDPATYSSTLTLEINATVTDDSALRTIVLEFNGTNYTATNLSADTYNVTLSGLSTGTYNYRWFANDTYGNANNSESGSYTINQADPSSGMSISLTTPISYPQTSDASPSETNVGDGGCSYSMDRSNGIYGVGTWDFNYSTSGCTNYSSGSVVETLTVNQNTTYVLGISGTSPIIYGATTDVAESDCPSELSCSLDKANGIYGVGTETFNYSTAGNTNYSVNSITIDITINQATPQGSISGTSPITYGTAGDVQGSESNSGDGDLTYQLFRDDVLVSNPDTTTLGAGTYSYIFNTTGGTNYTSNSSIGTFSLTVNQATSSINLTLEGTQGNTSVNEDTNMDLNCSIISGDSGAYLTLYNNGTLINNGTSPIGNTTSFSQPGEYNITCYYENTQNYSATSQTWFLTVDDVTKPDISIVYPTNNTNSTNNQLTVNYTISDNVAVDSCWYSNDSMASNTTLTDCANITSVTWTDGQHNVTIWVNDTSNNVNSSSVTFTVDTTAPTTTPSSTSPPDGASYTFNTWTGSNVKVTMTAYDAIAGYDNLAYPKYCTDLTNTCTPTTYISSGVTISTEGTSYIRYFSNDSWGNEETVQSGTIKIDTTPPNMTLDYPISGLNLSTNTSIDLNFTTSDDGARVDSCWYSLNGGTDNSTIPSCNNLTINVSEGSVTINIYSNDSVGNINDSESVTFITDLTDPSVTLISPENGSYNSTTTQNFTYNVSDNLGIKNTTLYLVNNYLDFDGDADFVQINYNQNFNLTRWENFSISFWFKTNWIWTGLYYRIFEQYDPTYADTPFSIYLHSDGDKIGMRVNTTGNSNTVNTPVASIKSDNTWYHIVGVYNGTHIILFLDGSVSATQGNIGIPNDNKGDLFIAKRDASYFNGSIDEVRFYNRALTQDEISEIYNSGRISNSSITNDGLVAWWNINKGSGTSIFDIENTNNGEVTGATWNSENLKKGEQSFTSSVTDFIGGFVVTITDGVYNWFIKAYDWAGNFFVSNNNTVTIDSTNPTVSIVYPTDFTNSTNTGLNVNFTTSDTYLDSCWWTDNGGTSTISCTNITTETWAQGTHNITVYANDSANNVEQDSVNFTIDNVPPVVSIVYPVQDASYSTNTIDLNYTVSDATIGLDTCLYQNDTDGNVTITCGQNTTISQDSDGTYSVTICANDSLNNLACDSVSYTISTTPPAVTLQYPASGTWFNSGSNLYFNYTATDANGIDSCQWWGNWTGTWHNNLTNIHGGDTSVDINEGNFTQTISDGFYKWNIYCNDSNNDAAWAATNRTFGIDSVNPLISYGTGIENNDTNTTSTYIYVNVSVTESNEDTITFNLYDSSNIIYNSTSFTDETREITWVSLPDGVYYYNVTINDSANNKNYTSTYLIRLDDTKPTITIEVPQAQNYGDNNSMELNYTASDNLIGLDECWYYIQNSSGNTVKAIETLSSCQNDTFTLPGGDIDYTLYLFAKDILANTQSSAVTFGIRTESPAVYLYPANDTYINNESEIYFNFSVTTNADSISNCSLYGNWSGWHLNQTITSPGESVNTNFSAINLNEGDYFWNVLCFDNFGTSGWGLINNTFVVDLTYPGVEITDITTTQGSQTINFDSNSTDRYSLTCKYSIFDSTGAVDGLNENVSFICNTPNIAATVSAYGTYNLTIYAIDKAGNENSTTSSFTTQAASSTAPSGGSTVIIIGNITEQAVNYSILATNLNDKMDLVLAKGSKASREKNFVIINKGIEEIQVELLCDSQQTLDKNQTALLNETSSNINICDYVYFEQSTLTVSPNEDSPTISKVYVDPPEGVELGDKYPFNILALRDISTGTQQVSKLSVTTRFPWWGLVLKESALGEEKTYPVAFLSLFIAFAFFIAPYLFLKKLLPFTSVFIGLGLFLVSFVLSLYLL